ncbi:uncharacterized protein EI97DRAFT_226166 [Westerdykella ornata]|uniref:Uncharacterized protein n=1 Tax=Westerdykella ornata TaxID=318751 RepID=A0A6A6JT66_WESOR|nr:uncharacterized protein EI97DRAFT_226166 [Westerdykella ornata]KAF2279038.1 hypothetical protein EI97DRAFT_226166 [Westerdykella ornata]
MPRRIVLVIGVPVPHTTYLGTIVGPTVPGILSGQSISSPLSTLMLSYDRGERPTVTKKGKRFFRLHMNLGRA